MTPREELYDALENFAMRVIQTTIKEGYSRSSVSKEMMRYIVEKIEAIYKIGGTE